VAANSRPSYRCRYDLPDFKADKVAIERDWLTESTVRIFIFCELSQKNSLCETQRLSSIPQICIVYARYYGQKQWKYTLSTI
jgi:hypothetical protein